MKNYRSIVLLLVVLLINSGCLRKHQNIGSGQDYENISEVQKKSEKYLTRIWFDRQGPHSLENIQKLDVDIIYFNGKKNFLDCYIREDQKTILEDLGFRLFVKPLESDSSSMQGNGMN